MILEFTLPGPPRPKERPRFGGPRPRTPERTKEYQGAIANVALVAKQRRRLENRALPAWPMDSTYEIECWFHFKKKLDSLPDGDNCLKAVNDALEGVLWKNDRRVLDMHCHTSYEQAEDMTKVLVTVTGR